MDLFCFVLLFFVFLHICLVFFYKRLVIWCVIIIQRVEHYKIWNFIKSSFYKVLLLSRSMLSHTWEKTTDEQDTELCVEALFTYLHDVFAEARDEKGDVWSPDP